MPTPREAFTNSVRADPIGGERLRAADYGAAGEMLGRAAQGFGQDLGKVAQDVEAIEIRDAEVAAQEADNIRTAKRLKILYGDPDSGDPGYFNTEGRNAVIAQQQLSQRLRQVDEEAAAVLKGKPRALRMFEQTTVKRDQDDMPRVAQHAARQRGEWEKKVRADKFDLAIDEATTAQDPAIIERNIQTVGNLAVAEAMREGRIDDVSILKARQKGVGAAVSSIAERMSVDSPAEAQAFVALKAEEMDPDDVGKILNQLAAPAAKERAGQEIGNFLVTTSVAAQVGTPITDPLAPAPQGQTEITATTIPPLAALDAAQFTGPGAQEGAASHTYTSGPRKGQLIESPAGALGVSQTMVATGKDPGYGITPLRNNSREEYLRFGRDYRKKMLEKYRGNIVLALTAYNWGPGNVDDHIKKVGDPTKGEISDAAFLNSIGVKEAREYAAKVLNKAGASVGGARTREVDPTAQSPTYQGEEINLAATYARIDAADKTFIEKEALKAEARERYSLGKQARSDAEDRLKDAAWTEINRFGDNFTDYDKLPLTIRQQLASNPTLEAQIRGQAEGNKARQQAAADAQATERENARAEAAELNALELYQGNPDEFLKRDWRTVPGLKHDDRVRFMGYAEALRKQRANPTNEAMPDHDAARTEVRRFIGGDNVIKDGKNQTPEQKALLSRAFDGIIRWEQSYIDKHKKRPSQAERAAQARAMMMPVQIQVKGSLWGSSNEVVPRFAAPTRVQELQREGRFGGARINDRTMMRAELTRLRGGRIPSEAEIDAALAEYKSGR